MQRKVYLKTPLDMYGLNYSQKYFKNLKDFIEAQKSKSASILYRKQLLEHRNKINYTNELDRIRGELSRNDTRLPIGTREMLESRKETLIKLGGQIVDEIK